jgi:predicted aldo/keto reductase-like oxidoreductase
MDVQKRTLGKTGEQVTILGLGGEGVLRTFGYEREAYQLINRAIDLGINYFESARAYSGSESYYGLALKERREHLFLTSKSHARDRKGASDHLLETLRNMKTDHLDLWQVHDVRTDDDMEQIFGQRGALEAFVEAKEKGLVRFIGVTGHQDPSIIRRCMEQYDFDTVLFPVNPAEPAYRSFLDSVLPLAVEKGIGIIGMKLYFRGLAARIPGVTTLEPFYRFALSHPLSTAVIGCDNVEQLEKNFSYATSFNPMSEEEMRKIVNEVGPYAKRLLYYKPQ